jgi:uncharacterized membrane protein
MMGDERKNIVLFYVLRTGILLSLGTMLLGLILFFISGDSSSSIAPERLLDELAAVNPVAVIELGILFLIATPLVRVIATLVMFSYERDMRFVAISLLVLSVIVVSILIEV